VGQRQTITPVVAKHVAADERISWPTLQPIKVVIAKSVAADGGVTNGSLSNVGAGPDVIEEVSAYQWTASSTGTDIPVSINEEPGGGGKSIDDAVVGQTETIERIGAELDQTSAAKLAGAVYRILVNGDVRAGMIQGDAIVRKTDEATVEYL
jgi:hypothetical protein